MLTCFLNKKLKLWYRQLTHHIKCNYVCSVYIFICFWLETLWLGRIFFFLRCIWSTQSVVLALWLSVLRFWKRACKQPSPESCDMMREACLRILFQRFHWNLLPKWSEATRQQLTSRGRNKISWRIKVKQTKKWRTDTDRVNGIEMCQLQRNITAVFNRRNTWTRQTPVAKERLFMQDSSHATWLTYFT